MCLFSSGSKSEATSFLSCFMLSLHASFSRQESLSHQKCVSFQLLTGKKSPHIQRLEKKKKRQMHWKSVNSNLHTTPVVTSSNPQLIRYTDDASEVLVWAYFHTGIVCPNRGGRKLNLCTAPPSYPYAPFHHTGRSSSLAVTD